MRRFLTLLAVILSVQLMAQKDEKSEVMSVVNRMFEAMRTNDSTMLKTCFTSDVHMSTVVLDASGNGQLRDGTVAQFVAAVGKPKTEVLNEPIWNEKVQIDGKLAAVWVDYAFYLTNTFSHCGVDAFHLVNTESGWKIFNIVDTRRKSDCDIPEDIRMKYEKN